MISVLSISLVACAIGALVAASPRARPSLDGPVRTFAIGAGLALVLTHLVPEAARSLGGWSLLAIGLGIAVPFLLRARRAGAIATELAYAGLLGWHVCEAARMSAAAPGAPAVELAVALFAHAMPTAALVLIGVAGRGSLRGLGLRAVGVGAAIAIGVAVAHGGGESVSALMPWGDGVAAGLLLFVIGRALGEEAPRTWGRRTADLAGLGVGVALTLAGTRAHWGIAPEQARGLELTLADTLLDTTLEAAPMLLLGLALGALVQALGGKIPPSWLRADRPEREALRGALMGAPVPVCACGILPVAEGLAARRAGAAFVVAFLLAAPQAGVETFALMARFLGVPFAAAHLAVALVTSVIGGAVIARAVARERTVAPALRIGGTRFELVRPEQKSGESCTDCGHDHGARHDHDHDRAHRSLAARWRAAFDEIAMHNAPWALIGIALAALVAVLVPAGELASFAAVGADVPLMALLAIPAYVCPASAAPLGAILIAKGLSPGAVLVAVTLGPATNVATLAFLRRRYGGRATALGVASLIGSAWLAAVAVNRLVPVALPEVATGEAHAHGALAWLAAIGFALVLARALWLGGPSAVLPGLAPSHPHAHPPDARRATAPA